MKANFICTSRQWRVLQDHLQSSKVEERFAILLTGHALDGDRLAVLCHKVIPFADPALVDYSSGVRLTSEGVVRMMNSANNAATGVFEVHSHPGADRCVSFSGTDETGHREIVLFALSTMQTGRIYGSLVFGKASFQGSVWLSPGERIEVVSVEILGPPNARFGTNKKPGGTLKESRRYSRQILAFGEVGQRRLAKVRVAIVGLGGIGSILARTLAYEGVRSFILVDPDRVERSNLNRLDGGKPWDARLRRRKVKISRREIKRIAPQSEVEIVAESVFTDSARMHLLRADILFGCTDTHSSRLYLNGISAGYLKPYIDAGSGITVEDGEITEAGGRVTVVLPGEGCLLDAHAINTRLAGYELASPNIQMLAEEGGYVKGADIATPAVMSLNQTVASVAATEFKAFVTGVREPIRQIYYDLLEARLLPGNIKGRESCLVCREQIGKGDLLEVSRRYGSHI